MFGSTKAVAPAVAPVHRSTVAVVVAQNKKKAAAGDGMRRDGGGGGDRGVVDTFREKKKDLFKTAF